MERLWKATSCEATTKRHTDRGTPLHAKSLMHEIEPHRDPRHDHAAVQGIPDLSQVDGMVHASRNVVPYHPEEYALVVAIVAQRGTETVPLPRYTSRFTKKKQKKRGMCNERTQIAYYALSNIDRSVPRYNGWMSGWLGGEVRWWWWCAQQRANTNDKLFRCRGRLILDTYLLVCTVPYDHYHYMATNQSTTLPVATHQMKWVLVFALALDPGPGPPKKSYVHWEH
ncbi:hypothetical protein SMMN14_01336 [Sphaerulina musiva]